LIPPRAKEAFILNPRIPSPESGIQNPESRIKNPAAWLIIIVAWAAIYLPGLGTRELQGEEARRVLPGRTMIQTGDWIVPRSAGRIYNRKPPMVNWAAAAAIKLTGKMNEWTVRLPSVLGILAMTLCVYGLGRTFLGGDGAFFAAIACLTNIGFIEKGRLIEIEALYISFFGIALMLWLHFWWREKPTAAWLTSMPVLGLAFLTKGPVHLWYFYAIIIAIMLGERTLSTGARTPPSAAEMEHGRPRPQPLLKHLLSWPHLLGLALFLATFLPWALTNAALNPEKDSGAVWSEQITHRLGFSEFDLTSWLLQIPQSLINFLPWALLLPLAWNKNIVAQWKAMGRRGVWIRALRNGLVIAFLIIAVLPSSRPRFMLPLNVAGAVLLAMTLFSTMDKVWTARIHTVLRRLIKLSHFVILLAVVVLLYGVLMGLFVGYYSGAANQAGQPLTGLKWLTPSLVEAIVFSAVILLAWRKLKPVCYALLEDVKVSMRTKLAVIASVFTGWVMIFCGWLLFMHLAARDSHLHPFAAEIRAHTGPDAPLILFRVQERMWPFYLGLSCREIAFQKELPTSAPWIITPKEDRDENLAILMPHYGPPKSEQIIKEPATGDAGGKGTEYVLLGY
jgi:hypothetical protein